MCGAGGARCVGLGWEGDMGLGDWGCGAMCGAGGLGQCVGLRGAQWDCAVGQCYGALWGTVGCYRTLRGSMESYGALWGAMECYEAVWVSMGCCYGALWGAMGCYGMQ